VITFYINGPTYWADEFKASFPHLSDSIGNIWRGIKMAHTPFINCATYWADEFKASYPHLPVSIGNIWRDI
jgi:hypothetical protein